MACLCPFPVRCVAVLADCLVDGFAPRAIVFLESAFRQSAGPALLFWWVQCSALEISGRPAGQRLIICLAKSGVSRFGHSCIRLPAAARRPASRAARPSAPAAALSLSRRPPPAWALRALRDLCYLPARPGGASLSRSGGPYSNPADPPGRASAILGRAWTAARPEGADAQSGRGTRPAGGGAGRGEVTADEEPAPADFLGPRDGS